MLRNPRSLSELAADANFVPLDNNFKLVLSKNVQNVGETRANIVVNTNVQLTLPRTGRVGERVGVFVSHAHNKSKSVVACDKHRDKALVDPKLDKNDEDFPGYSALHMHNASYEYDSTGSKCSYRFPDSNGQTHTHETEGYFVSVPVDGKAHVVLKSLCNGADSGKDELKLWHLTAKLYVNDGTNDIVMAETTFTVQFRAKLVGPLPAKRMRLEEANSQQTSIIPPASPVVTVASASTATTIPTPYGPVTIHPMLGVPLPEQVGTIPTDPSVPAYNGDTQALQVPEGDPCSDLEDLKKRYVEASEKWAENHSCLVPLEEFRKTVELKEAEAGRAYEHKFLREWAHLDLQNIVNDPVTDGGIQA